METTLPVSPAVSMDESHNPPWRRVVPPALFLVAVLAVAWRTGCALQGHDLFSDDAYYYAVTARNFVDTGRFTFDGSSLTNGFHPLLFWIEVAGFAVFGTSAAPMGQYLGLWFGMAAVFLATIGGCLWAVGVRAADRGTDAELVKECMLITLCVVLVPRFTTPYLGGMESVLVLPLVILLGAVAWKARYGLAGVAAVGLVMARLDTLPYMVVPIGLACAWREWRSSWPALRAGLLVVLPAVLATVVLVAWNQCYFGHPMPIHGVLKSCFPRVHFQWRQIFANPECSPALVFSLAAAVLGGALLLPNGKAGRDVRGLGLTAAVLALVQLAAFLLFQKWTKPIPVWYVGPAVLTGAFALAMGAANAVGLNRLRLLTALATIAVVAMNLVTIARESYRGTAPQAAPGASEETIALATDATGIIELMKSLPQDHVWACTDCGRLAFWGERRVVNLDGLVNDFHYQEALRDQRLAAYLRERGVRYLVFLAWDRPQSDAVQYEPMYECRVAPGLFSGNYDSVEIYVYSYQYLMFSDRISLPHSAEIWRSPAVRDGRAMCRLVVFDLRSLECSHPL